MNYEQFEKTPGKSVSLLNNDPEWNRFVRYESNGDEILVGYFRRKEYEDYVIKKAYEKNLIDSDSIEDSSNYIISISVHGILTTFSFWALKDEPIYKVQAKIVRKDSNTCVFEDIFLVRTPIAGSFGVDGQEILDVKDLDGKLYKLYSSFKVRREIENDPIAKRCYYLGENHASDYIVVRFNSFIYSDNFYDGMPYYEEESHGKAPCLRYDWKVSNCSNVVKGQHVCSVIKNPYSEKREEYKIFSPASGLIAFSINGIKTEYSFQEEMVMNIYELFSVYKNKEIMISHHYDSSVNKEEDIFDGKLTLSWEYVAERKLPPSEANFYMDAYYPGFEMVADSSKYIIVSLQVKNNIPFIVFSVNSNKIPLAKGDMIDLMFVDIFGEKKILSFPVKNYVEEQLEDIYDISYYCTLSESNIECMKENACVSWRIRFTKQPFVSISGYNESKWCPKEYAGEVFKAYANEFADYVDMYSVKFALSKVGEPKIVEDEKCYVYLMYDTSTGYYKIGISNNPEYRERTLQSEKPTIEKIIAKAYPNRTIAGAIESALHKSYDLKRLRGEWFALDANDVSAIIATLS